MKLRRFVNFNRSLELRTSGLVGQVVGTSEAPRRRNPHPHQSRRRLEVSLRGDLLTDRIRPENPMVCGGACLISLDPSTAAEEIFPAGSNI